MPGTFLSVQGPAAPKERIISLDALRGFAILGILMANIQIYSMIKVAEFNPMAFGDMTGLNYLVAAATHILVNRKFWTLFTLLFGAGIVMMSERIEARGGKPALRHYPRMFWLFVIGSLVYYLIAPGEILALYAVAGLFVYFCRKLSPRKLLIYGLMALCLPTILDVTFQFRTRTPQGLEYQRQSWQPDRQAVEEELALNQGPWIEQVKYRFKTRTWLTSIYFYQQSIWAFLGRMLLGMALFKWGILTGAARRKTYLKLLFYGLGIGLALSVAGWVFNSLINWDYRYSVLLGYHFNYLASVFQVPGYIAGVMLVCGAGIWKRLVTRLAAVGRMALTNFIMHGVICVLIFYGQGLGLGGKVERTGQILVVFAVWAFQLWLSPLWLKHFRFGPAEWLWRSLTYWKPQPMRIK